MRVSIFGVLLGVSFTCFNIVANTYANELDPDHTSLLDIYQKAVLTSPQLKSQEYDAQSSREYANSQLGLAFPNITITASAQVNGGNYTGNISGNYKEGNVGVVLNQALVNLGVFSGYKYSNQLALSSEANYNQEQQAFILQVAEAYFNILEAEDQVQFSETNLKASQSTLNQTRLLFKNGMETESSLKQAEASYYQAISTLTNDNNSLKVSYYDLYSLTGVLYKNIAPLKENLNFKMPKDKLDVWLKLARKNNYGLIAQRYTMAANSSAITAITSTFLPSLSLQASYGVTNYSGSNTLLNSAGVTSAHSKSAYVGLVLSWNILDGGVNYAQRKQAASTYESSFYDTINQTRLLEEQTRNDFNNLKAIIDQIKALKQSVKASKLSYEQFLEQYKVGTATISDVLNQQNILFQSMTNLAKARYSYINGVLQLKYDAGTISIKDIEYFNKWLIK